MSSSDAVGAYGNQLQDDVMQTTADEMKKQADITKFQEAKKTFDQAMQAAKS